MRKTFLPFSPPLIGEEEIAEVVDTLRSDWITTGPKVKRFEQEFAAAVGAPAALAVNSCTAALHLALLSLGIGPGDSVLTTPMTFCSTLHVIEQVGARPVLVDVEPDTLNLDPKWVRQTLAHSKAGRCKAILPVHLYGHACDMSELLSIARDNRLAVVEDAAHALPASYRGRMIGSFSAESQVPVLTCFSFYATKNLTTGEGGMLTGVPEILDAARIWSLHGMSRDAYMRYSAHGSWYYEVVRQGFKYNMTDIQAALGLAQLRKLAAMDARRREIVDRYNSAFGQMEEFQIPARRPDVEHAWHLYVLRLNLDRTGLGRDRFIQELQQRNIGTSVHFIPLHMQPYYRDKYHYQPSDFPVARREFERIVSLPLSPKLTDDDVTDGIAAVKEVVQQFPASKQMFVTAGQAAKASAPSSVR